MPIPIFELFTSTTRRIVRGMSPTEADTGHFHHVLVRAGLPVRAICALYFLVSLASCAVGVWASRAEVPEPLLFVGFCLMFGAWMVLVRLMSRVVPVLPRWFQRVDPAASH